ncbi:MAG TPA: alpha-amylase family glycosyl hydrolase, partial [Nitrolancea sp.]|nr:alpha-amylase family glycosyl hydrolase [Nitrolancea sp.]
MSRTAEANLIGEQRFPLGAIWDGTGVHFSLYSERATGVELCLFDDVGEERRIALQPAGHHVWQTYVANLGPRQRYGYRVSGPYDPAVGNRFNPHKLLLDPYARAIAGKPERGAPFFGYKLGQPDLTFDDTDDAAGVPKGLVIDPRFDWDGDEPPGVPLQQSVIYEVHVKGFTARHPEIPPEIRGTYAAMAHPAALAHLKALGVTAVELLPVHASFTDPSLSARGLSNYWGYSTLGYFAPDARFASRGDLGGQVTEFKEMVKRLHAAGLEVILDVVYNHTCEGNEFGQTLSLRGIDNRTYYRLVPGNERQYIDFTGTGNTLNSPHPQVLK